MSVPLGLLALACTSPTPLERAAATVEALEPLAWSVAEAEGDVVDGVIGGSVDDAPRGDWSATRTVLTQRETTCENGQGEIFACTEVHLTATVTLEAVVTGRRWRDGMVDHEDAAWSEAPAPPPLPEDARLEAPQGPYAQPIALTLTATTEIAGAPGDRRSAWEGTVAFGGGDPRPFAAWVRSSDTYSTARINLDGETWQWAQQYSSR